MNAVTDAPPSPADVPVREQVEELFPATNVQRALWLQANSAGFSVAQIAILELAIDGDVDCENFIKAASEVLAAHPVLGATPTRDGAHWKPGRAGMPALVFQDLSALAGPSRASRLRRLMNEAIDPAAGKLFSALLIREHATGYKLFLSASPIVADQASLEILVTQLLASCGSRSLPTAPRRPMVPLWRSQTWRNELSHRDSDSSGAYWQQALAQLPDAMSLHPDFPRKPRSVRRAGLLCRAIPDELVARCSRPASGCSMSDVFAAAFAIVLGRFCRSREVLFGVRVDARMQGDESLVGPLTMTLPFHISIGDVTTSRFIDAVAEVMREIRANGREADVNTLLNRPMSAITFECRRSALPELSAPDLRLGASMRAPEGVNSDLRLCVEEAAGRWTLAWHYDSELFNESTIERVQECYVEILKSLQGGDQNVRDVNLLSPAEVQRIVTSWNDTGAEHPSLCIHIWISQQATRTPDRIALQWDGGSLTYAVLIARANKLARHLLQNGLSREEVVGVCLHRSPEMVVALLAIYKAGGAYLPLEPDSPRERLHFMLEDCKARLVICDTSTRDAADGRAEHYVLMDRDAEAIDAHSDTAPEIESSPSALAHVLYTSGSTGKPKGVMVEHRNVVNFLGSMRRELQVSENEVIAQLTPLSFDIAGLELFLPLIVGARCVLVPMIESRDGQALQQQLRRHEVSLVQGTPSTWKIVTEAGALPPSVRKILCGGEALPAQLAILLHVPGIATWNVYGPTETTIWSTAHRLRADNLTSIGRPIDNTQIYLLDENMYPVPIGVPGDLYIGGHGVTRGYLNRPSLTAERFVENPFGPDGGRMYKTGDLARYHEDGTLQFLGRSDHQIKLHGARIEPGEIETQLQSHPEVAISAVVVRDDGGRQRLVAYVVRKPGSALSAVDLRSYARIVIPEYMVPRAFVFLEKLPLTQNGKLDRAALPAPGDADVIRSEMVAPSTPTEQTLVTICGEVLQRAEVSVLDNLFDLGGDSFAFLSIAMRVKETAGIEVPVHWIFESPIIRKLAEQIDTVHATALAAPPVPEHSVSGEGVAGVF